MATVMVAPAPCMMALVIRSLASRIAMSGSTGIFQSRMATRTWLRASAAAAGFLVSRTPRWYSSVGRVGAITFIRFLSWRARCLALKMLLQVAAQDIGQLTDIEPLRVSRGHSPAPAAEPPGWAAILRRPPGLYR